jgi:hypothetical protein
MPAGALVEANLTTPGVVRIVVASASPLPSGIVELVRLIAQVPVTAPYRDTQILTITNVSVNDGAIAAIGDDALHVAAYLGDSTGSGTYSALDAQRILLVVTGQGTGFATYLKIDPLVIADITANGLLSALDATRILQEVVGLDRPEIPPLPGIIVPSPVADPLVFIARNVSGEVGNTVTVPVNIDDASHLETVDMEIKYDAMLLDVNNLSVHTGSLTRGATLIVNVDARLGTIRLSMILAEPLKQGSGSLVEIDYRISDTAVSGSTRLDLTRVVLNEGALVLTTTPLAGLDPTDGMITIKRQAPMSRVATLHSENFKQSSPRSMNFLGNLDSVKDFPIHFEDSDSDQETSARRGVGKLPVTSKARPSDFAYTGRDFLIANRSSRR